MIRCGGGKGTANRSERQNSRRVFIFSLAPPPGKRSFGHPENVDNSFRLQPLHQMFLALGSSVGFFYMFISITHSHLQNKLTNLLDFLNRP